MSIQDARNDLAAALEAITSADGWMVTTVTEPDIHHKTIVVGHADLVEPDTFASYRADITVTIWVAEGDDYEAADVLYDLISPGQASLFVNLPNMAPIGGRVLAARAENVGRRHEGPSGFLAGDISMTLLVT